MWLCLQLRTAVTWMRTHVMRGAWESWLAVREERLELMAEDRARTAGTHRHANPCIVSFFEPPSLADMCCMQIILSRHHSVVWHCR